MIAVRSSPAAGSNSISRVVKAGAKSSRSAGGSISGTVYAPANRALFGDVVSGRANLAVMTSCMTIDGGNSTFDYKPDGLFGVGIRILGQWG